ncbi:hypothetical protein SY88_16615 [Clostridiales bacterium PH28_bin88]|nr:hypothetical protein SY88_16615 [Clostridiales bacterium PH28_bin88]
MGEMLALLATLFYSGSTLVIRKAVRAAPIMDGLFWTNLVNTALFGLATLTYSLAKGLPDLNSYGIAMFLLSAIGTSFFGRISNYRATQLIGPSRASQLMSTQTLFTVLIAAVLLHERPSRLQYLGILAIFFGVFGLVQENKTATAKNAQEKPGPEQKSGQNPNRVPINYGSLGILWGLASGLFYAIGIVARKAGLGSIPSVLFGAFLSSLAALILYIGQHLAREGQPALRRILSYPFAKIKYYLADGAFTTVAWYFLFTALTVTSASTAQAIVGTIPLFVLLYSRLILRNEEQTNSLMVASALLVTSGVVILLVR